MQTLSRRLVTLLSTVVIGLVLPAAAPAQTKSDAIPDLRIARGNGLIAQAWFAGATTRYRHFVLGSNYEADTLVVRTRDGRELRLTLPPDQVFEDREPRLADLDGDSEDEIVVIRSHVAKGAALVVVGVRNGALRIIAETAPTGRANTWLNPAGIADFDGDGRLDIAYVQMPHVLGRLRLITLRDGKLIELATLDDASNHVAGSPQLRLSAVADFNGDGIADLAIPSKDRHTLRFLTFKSGEPREFARKPLPAMATHDFGLEYGPNGPVVMVGLGSGRTARMDAR